MEKNLIDQLPTNWDAIVIGAGPAGSLAARQLAIAGRNVLLVERKAFPRPKVCGTCLNQHAIAVLDDVGLECVVESGPPVDSFQVGLGGRVGIWKMPRGVAISRSLFDQRLLDQAKSAGVHVLTEATATLLPRRSDDRQVAVQSQHQIRNFDAKAVVIASGLTTNLADHPPFDTKVAESSRIGAGCAVDIFPADYNVSTIFMAVGKSGYVGLTRVESGCLNIAAAFDAAFVKVAGSPQAAAALVLREAGFSAVPSMEKATWMGTVPLTRTTRPVASDRVFLIGDATGYVEPFTGEGMAWSLGSAQALAELLTAATPASDLESAWRGLFAERIGRRHGVCESLATLLRYPLAARLVFEAARVVPKLAGGLMASINRPPILKHAS